MHSFILIFSLIFGFGFVEAECDHCLNFTDDNFYLNGKLLIDNKLNLIFFYKFFFLSFNNTNMYSCYNIYMLFLFSIVLV